METGTLKDLNVQPGDVVECVKSPRPEWWTEGKHYSVNSDRSVTDNEGDPIRFQEHDGSIFRIVSRAKPAGPVRTVTRKELVCGSYGNVYVEKYDDRIGASMEFSADADRIRAAIATLTEIADALEGGL